MSAKRTNYLNGIYFSNNTMFGVPRGEHTNLWTKDSRNKYVLAQEAHFLL